MRLGGIIHYKRGGILDKCRCNLKRNGNRSGDRQSGSESRGGRLCIFYLSKMRKFSIELHELLILHLLYL